MSFSPGQFITAQRLNRLQRKSYFGQSSGFITTVSTGDLAGSVMSIAVETNGAIADFWFSAAVYATGAMTNSGSVKAQWDVNASPTFALGQYSASGEKGVSTNMWSTTITTAGTYTFKLVYNNVANSQLSPYCSLLVQIAEVA